MAFVEHTGGRRSLSLGELLQFSLMKLLVITDRE